MSLFRRMAGILPSAMSGICAIYHTRRTTAVTVSSPMRCSHTRPTEGGTHLHHKEVEPDLLRHDGHDELVRGGAEEEGDEHGALARELVAAHRRRVHVPEQEGVHRPVPLARELVPRGRVPPVVVERPVGKAVHMSQVSLACEGECEWAGKVGAH